MIAIVALFPSFLCFVTIYTNNNNNNNHLPGSYSRSHIRSTTRHRSQKQTDWRLMCEGPFPTHPERKAPENENKTNKQKQNGNIAVYLATHSYKQKSSLLSVLLKCARNECCTLTYNINTQAPTHTHTHVHAPTHRKLHLQTSINARNAHLATHLDKSETN